MSEPEEFREAVYGWSLNLINEGYIYEGIFLMLSTWNFACFRYVTTSFPLNKFKRVFENLDFDYFKDKSFESIDFNNRIVGEKIKEIYKALSEFEGIKYVGATKIMHLMCPKTFVMWDAEIRDKIYKVKTSPEGYLNFLKKMQKMHLDNKFKNLDKNVTIPRAIDKYNLSLKK